jgi:hypothetical protein
MAAQDIPREFIFDVLKKLRSRRQMLSHYKQAILLYRGFTSTVLCGVHMSWDLSLTLAPP